MESVRGCTHILAGPSVNDFANARSEISNRGTEQITHGGFNRQIQADGGRSTNAPNISIAHLAWSASDSVSQRIGRLKGQRTSGLNSRVLNQQSLSVQGNIAAREK